MCAEEDRVEVPVGRACLGCGRDVEEGDCGFLIPLVAEVVSEEPWHRGCFLRTILPDDAEGEVSGGGGSPARGA